MATTTGGIKVFITTVSTRWGTQFLQIKSINRFSEDLKIYAEKPDDIDEPIFNLKASHLHRNCDFWQENKDESNKVKFDKVHTRWATVEAHLREWSVPGISSLSEDIASYYLRINKNGGQACKAQQVLPIHYVAYEPNPQNWSKLTDPTEQEIVYNFILERGEHRHKDSAFNPLRECWCFTEATKPFWNISMPYTHALFTIALELYSTAANSVPSEQKVLIDQQIEEFLMNQEDEIVNNVVDHEEEENWEDPYGLNSFEFGIVVDDLDNFTIPELEII
ncbi:hypothetical protein GcC1_201026 [Golovinomyces cichoracearum]|uniref:Uncharacterized protein n=1 Tax=Golovinomyces cichoracearum TaxID=62708 RepID=A0A420HEC3_9PEZI|nr:hypothetical protein GcC1_201026 [Golovinomyces cichoracearum]